MYRDGENGYPQNYAKAVELWHRAGDLGCGSAYSFIGYAYHTGRGVERDNKKATHYYELAAMEGSEFARFNLGAEEYEKCNMDRALKHWTIAATDGHPDALDNIKSMYMDRLTTKDDFAKVLRSYQAYLEKIKSKQRDEAAAFSDDYKYYECSV